MDIISKLISELENHKCYQSIHRPFILRQQCSVWGYCRILEKAFKITISSSIQSIIIKFYLNPHLNIIDIIEKGIFKHCDDAISYSRLYHLLTAPSTSAELTGHTSNILDIAMQLNANRLFMKTLSDNISLALRWTRNTKRIQSLINTETDGESSSCGYFPRENVQNNDNHYIPYNNNNDDEYQYSSSESSSYHSAMNNIQQQTPNVCINQRIQQDIEDESSSSSSVSASLSDENVLNIASECVETPGNTITIPSDKRECDKCTFHNHFRANKCKICGYQFKKKKQKQQKHKKQQKQNINNKKKARNRNRKPKYWYCNRCGFRNKKLTPKCRCGEWKPLHLYEWRCTCCTATNHVNNTTCIVCLEERKYDNQGDWQCRHVQCYMINTRGDRFCSRCSRPKVNVVKKKIQHKKKWNKYDISEQKQSVKVVIERKDEKRRRNDHNNGAQWSQHVGKYREPRKEHVQNNAYDGYGYNPYGCYEDNNYSDRNYDYNQQQRYNDNQQQYSNGNGHHYPRRKRPQPPPPMNGSRVYGNGNDYNDNNNNNNQEQYHMNGYQRGYDDWNGFNVGDQVHFKGEKCVIKNIVNEFCRVENMNKKLSNAHINELQCIE